MYAKPIKELRGKMKDEVLKKSKKLAESWLKQIKQSDEGVTGAITPDWDI